MDLRHVDKLDIAINTDDIVVNALLKEYLMIRKNLKSLKGTNPDPEYLKSVGKDLRCVEHVLYYMGVQDIEEACQILLYGQ